MQPEGLKVGLHSSQSTQTWQASEWDPFAREAMLLNENFSTD